MSQWTHVSGIFRIDGMPKLVQYPSEYFKDIFGTPSTNPWLKHAQGNYKFPLEEDSEYEQGKDIPGGSEGTIQYEVIHAGEGMVWKTVAVWGDLRDFDTENATKLIDVWFHKIINTEKILMGFIIRAAHLFVEVENGPHYILLYNTERPLNFEKIPIS